jgi:hypothetical protein
MKSYNGYEFSNDLVVKDMRRLINQTWKLLPMRENNEDWQKQLDSVLIELYGLHKIFGDQLEFLELLTKLEGVVGATDFMIYRASVFSAISLLTDLANTLDVKKS